MIEHISDAKLLHMRSVAELMYERALEWTGDEQYAQDMYVTGLLHDIGYIFGSDNHGQSGADLLERNGFKWIDAVRYHGKIDVADEDMTQEILLMQWCDMSVLPGGARVSCEERLANVGERYGFDSPTYEETKQLMLQLAKHGLH